MTTPKTKSSHAWVGLSNRIVSAFKRQARRQAALGVTSDLVFNQPNGAHCDPNPSSTTSTGSAPLPVSRESGYTTYATSPPH